MSTNRNFAKCHQALFRVPCVGLGMRLKLYYSHKQLGTDVVSGLLLSRGPPSLILITRSPQRQPRSQAPSACAVTNKNRVCRGEPGNEATQRTEHSKRKPRWSLIKCLDPEIDLLTTFSSERLEAAAQH